MRKNWLVQILLRISLSSVFLYAAVAATLQPQNWLIYIPPFLQTLVPASLLLQGFSFFQIVLALWILTGWKTKFSAGLASITLLAIIVANSNALDILFRDFAIFFAGLALLATDWKKK